MPEISVDIESKRPVIAANLEELRYLVFQGMRGENGDSAYELAVELGFEGTEQEWLDSLHGKDGKNYGIVVDGSEDHILELKAVEAGSAATVTPQEFGAKGDGVTDDTEAVQAALDSLNEKGGGTIFFPVGTYLVSASLQSYPNITWVGEGGASVIKLNAIRIPVMLDDDNRVENLTFNGNADNLDSDNVKVNTTVYPSGSRITISNCKFLNAVGSSISSPSGVDVKILNNVIDGYGDHAVYFSTNSGNILIEGNIIYGNGAGNEALKVRDGVNNIVIANNTALNVACFLMLDSTVGTACSDIVVRGNIATTVNHAFLASTVSARHENILISGNQFENVGNYAAFSLKWNGKDGCRNVTITDNIIRNYNSVTELISNTEDGLENISILNSIFEFGENITTYLRLGRAKNVKVIGNTFAGSTNVTNAIGVSDNADAEVRNNSFMVSATWLFNLGNRSNVKISFDGNTIYKLYRRLINNPSLTGSSLVKIKNNNFVDTSASYQYFYDRSEVADPTKYYVADNVVNGAVYSPPMTSYIPSYVGQMTVSNGVAYVATGTTAATDWTALNSAT